MGSQRKDIVVRSADKGGAVIVLDSGLYDSLNKYMLADIDTYRPLSHNPTSIFQTAFTKLLEEGVSLGAISTSDMKKLTVNHPIVPIFHSFPKIHKGVFPPLLRPIVAGIGSIGERLSAWVDSYLQALLYQRHQGFGIHYGWPNLGV